jgi:hypothetical protein
VTFLYSNRYSEEKGDTETADYLKKIGVREVFCYQGPLYELLISAAIRRLYLLCDRIPPLDSQKYTSHGMRSWFKKIQSDQKPEIIWMNYAHNNPLIDREGNNKTTLVIDYHDLVSVNHRMLIAIKKCFSGNRPFTIADKKVLDENFFASHRFPMDTQELQILSDYDKIVAISPEEAEIIRKSSGGIPVIYIPVMISAVDCNNTYSGPAIFATGPNAFNLQGYFYFLEKVLPHIFKKEPDFSLWVTGSTSDEVSPSAGITLLGFVQNLENNYCTARFSICPVLGGTGQQIKIVEAMAHGLPVVATRYSARTSPIVHGYNGFVAENAFEFAEFCIRLWQDPDLCKTMGEAARKTVRDKYSENLLQDKLLEVLR